ncbi:nuclear transport factor 2 family protein [Peribacillus simplex]|uniref:Nuclear transport factor 2 family protein n=2 Tax=Peribacillus simplex TaxID=1478 RepID=A0A9X8ZHD6_9BACI|nr:nuclear transport factor 2 family protein [Peribacillus simplex]
MVLKVGRSCITSNQTNLNDEKEVASPYMSEDKQKILAVYHRIDDAMVNKDTETLDYILDDNYVSVHMTGYQQSKQEWLEQIENEEMRYFKTMPQKTTITIDDNIAILICETKIDARIYGFRNTWSMKINMYFEKRGINWYPVNASASSNN